MILIASPLMQIVYKANSISYDAKSIKQTTLERMTVPKHTEYDELQELPKIDYRNPILSALCPLEGPLNNAVHLMTALDLVIESTSHFANDDEGNAVLKLFFDALDSIKEARDKWYAVWRANRGDSEPLKAGEPLAA
jgi:hypothetical protein